LAYRGNIRYGNIPEIEITRKESIEAILYTARKKQYFIDLSQQTRNEGNSWMFDRMYQTYLHSTGPYEINYIPRNQYDGILFIDTVTRPEFVY
jgi:erythromycin esterase